MSSQPYVFSRNAAASVRLYFQHWMWRYQTGYLLHPEIPLDKEGLKIADIACGTGIWLIELAKTLPAATQLDGYDISSAQFPPKEWWPKNVNLQTLDALGAVPEELVGKYDVVHVGLLCVVVRNEDPAPVLKHLMALLKPGGYLQWDENDGGSARATPVDPAMAHPHTDRWAIQSKSWFTARGFTYKWISELDKLFTKHGLQVLSYRRLPISSDIAKPWTDMQLMATEDILEQAIIPSCSRDGSASPSPDEWREMFQNVVGESKQGMSITMDMVVVVGRKAAQ
ncbi:hypothetical protein MMC08_006253 [Hypocenomyce scalaris]|nr:hypothetical protein [Hypocenomyce scalaris]